MKLGKFKRMKQHAEIQMRNKIQTKLLDASEDIL
jgi:hypothetical protein